MATVNSCNIEPFRCGRVLLKSSPNRRLDSIIRLLALLVVLGATKWTGFGQTRSKSDAPPLPTGFRSSNPGGYSQIGSDSGLTPVLPPLPSGLAALIPRVESEPTSGNQTLRYVLDRILIQPKRSANPVELQTLHARLGVEFVRTLEHCEGLAVVGVPEGQTVETLIASYESSGFVEYAEPDYLVRLAGSPPNDPRFLDGTLWGLDQRGESDEETGPDIDAPEAWETRRSAEQVIVAVVDSGVRYTHEDLAANMWIDLARGGHGLDALTRTNEPMDDNGHGTLMAGILGAVGNNGKGIVGVAWQLQIMACRFVDSFGYGTVSDAIACIEFARNRRVKIINASWGFEDYSEALYESLIRMRDSDVIVVAAAGNEARNIDHAPFYPASYDLDNIVSVAATTRNDDLLFVSNYGNRSVDLGAPGEQILSTSFESDEHYSADTGSSSAAAFVSGALALVRAQYPRENYRQAIRRIFDSVDPVSSLKGKSVTGGRLNLRKAMGSPVAAPRIWYGRGESPGSLIVYVAGEIGTEIVVESSRNLRDWEPIFTSRVPLEGVFILPPEIAKLHQREFFRAFTAP